MKYPAYPEYQDSDLNWVGEFPKHWEKKKVKHLFRISKEKSFEKDPTILSLTLNGIKIRDISSNEGQIAASYEGYHKIRKGDIVMNPMDLISGFVDCAKIEGVISPAYSTLRPIKELNPDFYNYYFQKHYYEKIFFPFAEGVSIEYRWTLKNADLMEFSIIEPPLDEQKNIVSFLDFETNKINLIIKKYDELIDVLKKKRNAFISEVVIKGLNKDVELKDSGIEWIGKIPVHWEIFPLFAYFKEKKFKNKGNLENNVLSLSYGNIIKRNVETNFGLLPSNFETYQIVEPNNIILRLTDLQNDKKSLRCGLVKEKGIITSAYLCLKNAKEIDPNFAYNLLHGYDLMKVFYFMGDGVRQSMGFSDMKWLPLIIPPLEEQMKISSHITKKTNDIDLLISKIKFMINLLKEYKISLISHAVTGKIDVREQASK